MLGKWTVSGQRGMVGQLVEWSQAYLAEIDAARARYENLAAVRATVDE